MGSKQKSVWSRSLFSTLATHQAWSAAPCLSAKRWAQELSPSLDIFIVTRQGNFICIEYVVKKMELYKLFWLFCILVMYSYYVLWKVSVCDRLENKSQEKTLICSTDHLKSVTKLSPSFSSPNKMNAGQERSGPSDGPHFIFWSKKDTSSQWLGSVSLLNHFVPKLRTFPQASPPLEGCVSHLWAPGSSPGLINFIWERV